MKYYSEVLNKFYDSAADVLKAEELHDKKLAEEKAKKEELANARKARADEVERAFKDAQEARKKANEAYKKANKVLSDFCKDYGAYHKTYKDGEDAPSIWGWFPFTDWFDFKL